jgi:hypothetical protein
MAKLVTHFSLEWSDPVSGTYALDDIESAEFPDGDSAETHFNINQQPIGVRTARGASTISLSQRSTVENATLPPWKQLKRAGAQCLITKVGRAADGTEAYRTQFDVRVATVSTSTAGEGNEMREITLAVVREDDQ